MAGVKVTNHLTGEVSEYELKTADQAKDLYLQLSADIKALGEAQGQVKEYLDEWLGPNENYEFSDGKTVARKQRVTKTWTTAALRHIGIDEDALDTITKVNMTAAKKYVAELVKRGEMESGDGRYLDEHADIATSKPYLEIR